MYGISSRPATRLAVVAALLLGFLALRLAIDLTGFAEGRGALLSGVLLVLGGLVAIGGIWTDAIERNRAEAERQRFEQRLRLSQRLEAVGRLTGGIAHEFNNWLTTILGYSDLLAKRLGEGHPHVRDVAEIRRAGHRAASLVDQLLAFSRRQVIDPRVLDLNRLVTETADLLQGLIGEDVELECRFGSDPIWVEADPSQLEQLLVHLAVHARDSMPAGGRLEIATDSGPLRSARPGDLFEVEAGEYCRLTITDTGGGIDPETLRHLFEPFYTTVDSGLGSGLGLATVYGIVKQNQGYIWVDSEIGKGTVFSVHLPCARERVTPATLAGRDEDRSTRSRSAPPSAPEPRRRRERERSTILLVEDEEMVRSLIREVLSQEGYDILEASGAEEAIDCIGRHEGPIDLMLTDVVMPGMPGNALARRLTEDRPDLRVLYISGYTESHLTQRGVLPTGERLLQKPFTTEELVDAVAAAIESGGVPERRPMAVQEV